MDPDDLGRQMPLWSWVPTAASAMPRISRKWAPSMESSVTSSTTKATFGFACTLWYFALPPMLNPAMSMVPSVGLYVNPSGLT